MLSLILCDSGLNTICAQFSLNFRIIFSNISMERCWFFSLFPQIHPQMKTIVFSALKSQKNFKLEKLFILVMSMYTKMSECILGVHLCFHCFSSLMVYKNHSCYSKFPNSGCVGFLFFFQDWMHWMWKIKDSSERMLQNALSIRTKHLELSLPVTEHNMETPQLY